MADDDDDGIRARAYSIWEAEGRPEGDHDSHWHRAREEMGHSVDPMTAAILPQATILEPDPPAAGATREEDAAPATKQARKA